MFAINPYEEVSSKCQSSADVCASKGGGEQKAEQKRVNFKYNLLYTYPTTHEVLKGIWAKS